MAIDNTGFIVLTILFLPLLSFIVLIFAGKSLSNKVGWLSVGITGICFLLSAYLFTETWDKHHYHWDFEWFSLGENITIRIGILIDNYAIIMLLVINFVALLVHIYSIAYKKGDKHYNRFFAYLGIFIFSMTGIVISDNLLTIFIFWELVGFTSYLLIGFWYDKTSAVLANKKAFLINRAADLAFLVAIMVLWSEYDTLEIDELHTMVFSFHHSMFWVGLAGLGIFIGCMGKSAQFPFQIWLPDAMEGPTPISALIHAATMVAAGIYLLIKFSFLLTPEISNFIVIIGTITAFLGAFSALSQYDLKRILAFSTVSQLGFMVAGIGAGAYEASFFHLITHAFFKACLFLSAGSIIHAFHHVQQELEKTNPAHYFDKQDIRNMGGVGKYMPITTFAFIISACALTGLPLFSGFLSKDAILTAILNRYLEGNDPFYAFISVILFITTFMTAYYVARMAITVFIGKLRIKSLLDQASLLIRESELLITLPLILLAFMSIGINPIIGFVNDNFLGKKEIYSGHHIIVATITIILAISGITGAYLMNKMRAQFTILGSPWEILRKISFHQLYMDKANRILFIDPILKFSSILSIVDNKIIDKSVNLFAIFNIILAKIIYWFDRVFIDGIINLTPLISNFIGRFSRTSLQGGKIQGYFLWALLGFVLILGCLLLC